MKKSKKNILSTNAFPVVGIGASAGGLEAFKKLVSAIPEDSGMAFVLVQHLDPKHKSLLPELLQNITSIPVVEITNHLKVKSNHIYVIPSNKVMVANDGVLELNSIPSIAKSKARFPIDQFFMSLAEVHQNHAIGVVLSGTASDGTLGLKAIRENGGLTFAQDEESAAFTGMPTSAILAGVVDYILPPEKIPQKIQDLNEGKGKEKQREADLDEDFFNQVIAFLHMRKGVDFTYYKKSTIRRRIRRRMGLSKKQTPSTYLSYLKEAMEEVDTLYQDLLIPVTSFFRDPKVFEHLSRVIFPALAKSKPKNEPLRIWIAGCSTGQEAYSMAISVKEFAPFKKRKVQFFATDINEQGIAKARTGAYTKSEVEHVSPKRLEAFFTKTKDNYQINKNIHESVVFVTHNFIKDPPFAKMDLISCRNVFIYMEIYLQKKALEVFHYALNPKGFLLLGKSEAVSSVTNLFNSKSATSNLFTKKDVPTTFAHVITGRRHPVVKPTSPIKSEPPHTDFHKAADALILKNFTPASVVVNEAMEIVQFRGSTKTYLEQAPGKPSHQLLKMAKEGLPFELRNLLHKARKGKKPVTKDNIAFKLNGTAGTISIDIIPLTNIADPHYLVLFQDTSIKHIKQNGQSAKAKKDANAQRIAQLGEELAQTHEDMRSITEDQEAVNEELQSVNEELTSSSEETQSLNEELETSKEELQSTNEELIVVNQELLNLNEYVTEAKDYAEAIIATMRDPFLVLDKHLRIKAANQSYYKAFQVEKEDVEGMLIYELDSKCWNLPALRNLLEKILPQKSIFNDFEITQTFSAIGERILLLNAREIKKADHAEKLILLAIKDITDRKYHESQINELLNRFQNLVSQAPVSICIIQKQNYLVELANDAYLNLLGMEKEFINKPLFESIPELIPQGFQTILDKVIMTGDTFIANEMEVQFPKHKRPETGYYSFSYQPLRNKDHTIAGVIAVGYDVTNQVLAKRKNQADHDQREKLLEDKVLERTLELKQANQLLLQKNIEKGKRAAELVVANEELIYQFSEKEKRAAELVIANEELAIQNTEKEKRAAELIIANEELAIQNTEKEKRAAELIIANEELAIQNTEKEKKAAELIIANEELAIQNTEKEKRAAELIIANEELAIQNTEKEKKAAELIIANEELAIQNTEKEKKAAELIIANKELVIQNTEKEERAAELVIANQELAIQNTEKEKRAAELAIANEVLAVENAEKEKRAAELIVANEHLAIQNEEKEKRGLELIVANQGLKSFTYIASHDLQEPLRKIQTFAKIISEKENANLSVNGKDYFKRIEMAANRMQILIDDLLAYSRINTNTQNFSSVDLTRLVEEVRNDFKESIEAKKAKVEIHTLGNAFIIPFQFRQLIQNLLGNALKFSDAARPLQIVVKSEVSKGSKFMKANTSLDETSLSPDESYRHISVSDNGIGFEPQFKNQIFDLFQRLHDKDKYVGTGIGLAIVKKIVENHHGAITATGHLDHGSTFDIYIPQPKQA